MRKLEFLDIVRAQDKILFSQMQIPGYQNPDAETRMMLSNTAHKLLESHDQALIDAFADHPEDLYQEITDTVTASGKSDFKAYRTVMNVADGIKITYSKANYIEYLQDVLCRPYFKALAEYGLSWDQPLQLINDHANRVFTVKHHAPNKPDGFLEIASSTIVAYHVQVLSQLDAIPDGQPGCKLKAWKRLTGDKELLEVHFHDKKRDLVFTLPIPGKTNIHTLKLFLFLLGKVNEQAFDHTGKRLSDRVSFPIQELIDIGIYTDPKNATRGFLSSADIIPQIRIKGLEASFDGSIENQSFANLPYFTGYEKPKGSSNVTFYLETRQNWKPILDFYMILPKSVFSIRHEKAFLLIYEIFLTARRNAKKNKIKITFEHLQKVLNLPDEKAHDKVREKILNPILEAIEIASSLEEITIEKHEPTNANARQILDDGYIYVSLKGEARKRIRDRAKAIEDTHPTTTLDGVIIG